MLWFVRPAQDALDPGAPGRESSSNSNTHGPPATEFPSTPLGDPDHEAGAVTLQEPGISECPLALALPSVSDIEVASCKHPFGIAGVLEQELRDPGWATDMETRIQSLVSRIEGLAAVRLEMECRMTACGVLLVFTDEGHYRQLQAVVTELADSLKDELGFRMWGLNASGAEDGPHVATIALMRAAERDQFQPQRPMLSALPGTSGFDIPLTGMAEFDNALPAKLLADEIDAPAWSRPMESLVTSETAVALSSEGVSRFEVRCRSTMCGIALRFPPGSEPQLDGIENQLAGVLGFERGLARRYPSPSGMMVTIYLRNPQR